MAFSSHIMKNREEQFSIHAFCPLWDFTDVSHIFAPAASFPAWRDLPCWITPFTAACQTLCHPGLLSLNPFQFCLSIFEMQRTVRCSQDWAAPWSGSRITKLFLFYSVPFPVTPTIWAASTAATELFIEIWIITPRIFPE